MKKFSLSLLAIVLFATSCKKEMATFQRGTLESFEQPQKIAIAPKAVTVNEEVAVAPTALEKQEVVQVTEEIQTVVEKHIVVVTPVLPKSQANVQATLAPTSAEQKLNVKEKIAVKAVKKQLKKEATAPLAEGKSQLIALLLALLVGVVGVHRFYLGYTKEGIIQLLTGGGCGVWTLIDIIRIATGDLKPKDGNYTETL
jgi:TM2 domain-containing membrane protein YozV